MLYLWHLFPMYTRKIHLGVSIGKKLSSMSINIAVSIRWDLKCKHFISNPSTDGNLIDGIADITLGNTS